jgi:O-antigen ligase
MIRYTLLYLALFGLLALTMRNWFIGLCGLLFLTVLSQHPNMPTNMLDIQGLNLWNVTLAWVLLFFRVQRGGERPGALAPPWMPALITLYVGMVLIAGTAAVLKSIWPGDLKRSAIIEWFLVDGIVNPLKYLLVGVLVYLGATTRERIKAVLICAIVSGLTYSLLVFKSMKLMVFTIDFEDARRMTDKLVGLFANDLGELLAFCIWAAVAVYFVLQGRWSRRAWVLLIVLSLPVFVAVKSRAGFFAFGCIGLVLGALRWRRILWAGPVAAVLVAALVPSIRARVLAGFGSDDGRNNWDEISAGRLTNIWPPVLEQISKSPFIGHGRYAIVREECAREIIIRERELPSHPHNSYLEILLDAGVAGLLICLTWMAMLGYVAVRLVRTRGDPLVPALGTAALAAWTAELAAGVAGSSFFPSQSTVPALVVWAAALRVYVELEARVAELADVPAALPVRWSTRLRQGAGAP